MEGLTPRERLISLAQSGSLNSRELLSLAKVWREQPDMEAMEILGGTGKKKLQAVNCKGVYREELLEKAGKRPAAALTILDEAYPPMLREIADPPAVFFYAGNQELLYKPCLAIVGSRAASAYGQEILENLLPGLLAEKIVIVSGLAAGIDGMAHRYTMAQGGHTIGVIGTGLGQAYPASHASLQQSMSEKQLVVSEFPFHAGPRREHFPQRNRIIAGLTQGTLVIQAKQRSGSLITANYALQYNREVFAVPGSILDENSLGANQLIQAGAKAVLTAFDILEEMQYIWN